MTGVRPKVVRIVQSWPGEDEKKGKNGAFYNFRGEDSFWYFCMSEVHMVTARQYLGEKNATCREIKCLRVFDRVA